MESSIVDYTGGYGDEFIGGCFQNGFDMIIFATLILVILYLVGVFDISESLSFDSVSDISDYMKPKEGFKWGYKK